jgi:hypothetical protein
MNVAPVTVETKPARSISLRRSHLADPLLFTTPTIGPTSIAA